MTGIEIALIIVGILIAIVALASCITAFWLIFKYSAFNRRENSLGLSGTQIARKILSDHGLSHIAVTATGSICFGNSYSHYFQKVRLRRLTRNETSITSLGMGAQKAALALLDKEGDPDMQKRIRLVPLITFGPFAFIPLVVIGLILDLVIFSTVGACTLALGVLGFLFYAYAIVLSVMTLKTERKAQLRAYDLLRDRYGASEEDLSALRELFRLYNVQYVNDIILSSLELIYRILKIVMKIKKLKD